MGDCQCQTAKDSFATQVVLIFRDLGTDYHPENRWFQNCGSFVLAEFDTPDLTFTVRVNFQDYKETNDGAINFGFKSVLFPIQAALTEFTIG